MKTQRLTSFALALALLSAVTIGRPQPARAIVGITSGNAALTLVGGAATFAGFVLAIPVHEIESGRNQAIFGLTSLSLFVGGMILLDSDGQPQLKYTQVDSATAAKWDMSPEECQAFNGGTDEANAVAETVGADMKAQNKFDIETSKSAWATEIQSLDPTLRSATIKVNVGIARQMRLIK